LLYILCIMFKILVFFIIMLFAVRLHVKIGILPIFGKHMHYHIISLRGEVWPHQTSIILYKLNDICSGSQNMEYDNKMKNTVRTVQKLNRKIVERSRIDTPTTHTWRMWTNVWITKGMDVNEKGRYFRRIVSMSVHSRHSKAILNWNTNWIQ
jgi:hypothetical protein